MNSDQLLNDTCENALHLQMIRMLLDLPNGLSMEMFDSEIDLSFTNRTSIVGMGKEN